MYKFADDTTVIDCIKGGDESACRREIENLAEWCNNNIKELIVGFRRGKPGSQKSSDDQRRRGSVI